MTVQECYQQIQGNYENVLKRLKTDERICGFFRIFLADTTYQQLSDAVEAKDYAKVFKCAHDLKGMGLNLGLTQLQQTSEILCDTVRSGAPAADIAPLFQAVSAAYQKAADAIQVLIQT